MPANITRAKVQVTAYRFRHAMLTASEALERQYDAGKLTDYQFGMACSRVRDFSAACFAGTHPEFEVVPDGRHWQDEVSTYRLAMAAFKFGGIVP